MALGDEKVIEAVLADWRTAPVSPKLRAMLGFLEKMTLSPESLNAEDAAALRAAGLSDEAIEDAVHICGAFNTINRIADTLGFDLMDRAGYDGSAKFLMKVGYI